MIYFAIYFLGCFASLIFCFMLKAGYDKNQETNDGEFLTAMCVMVPFSWITIILVSSIKIYRDVLKDIFKKC